MQRTNANDTRKSANALGGTWDVLYTIKMRTYDPIRKVEFVQEAKTFDRFEYLCFMVDLEQEGADFFDSTIYESDFHYSGNLDEIVTAYTCVHKNYEETLNQPTWFSYDSYYADSYTGERLTCDPDEYITEC